MTNVSLLLTILLALCGLSTAGWAEGADPRVERVRRDLGYYKQQEDEGLAVEFRNLRDELRQSLDRQDKRIGQLEEAIKQLKLIANSPQPTPPASPIPAATPISPVVPANPISSPALPVETVARPAPASAAKPAAAISVCYQGCDFRDLQQAVNASPPGGVVTLAAEINGTCAVIAKPLRLQSLMGKDGTRARLIGGVCIGKGALVLAGPNISIEGLEISGINVGDGNGACIRLDPGSRDITLKNLYCHDSQDGILGEFTGRLTIENSRFEGNGFGNGQAHGIYLTKGDEAVIRRSQILSSKNAGHSLKSGVRKLMIEDSIIAALNGHNSRALDAFGGGDITLRRNVIQQGPESDNSEVIGLALEPSRLLPNGHSVLLEDNWILFDNDNRGQKTLFRGQKLGPIVVRNNLMVGLTGTGLDGITEEGNRWAKNRSQAGLPVFDGTLASLPTPGKKPAPLDDPAIPAKPGSSWLNLFR